MGLPAKLKNFNVFNDGNNYLGQVAEVALPKLAIATEEWRGGGMLGPIDADMGLQKLEMDWKCGGLMVGVLRQFGIARHDGAMLRFNGAYQEEGLGLVTAAELVVRGRHVEIDPGTAKAGEGTEWSIKSSLSYLKWRVNGRTEVEIDMLNCVFLVDGIDRMAAIRLALAL